MRTEAKFSRRSRQRNSKAILDSKSRSEAPEKITDSFPIAAQMAKGRDIVIWAHDKVGEWADAGLIALVEISEEFGNRIFPEGLASCAPQ